MEELVDLLRRAGDTLDRAQIDRALSLAQAAATELELARSALAAIRDVVDVVESIAAEQVTPPRRPALSVV